MVFKERLAGEEVLRGVLAVIPSAVSAQAIAAAGADFLLVDREHGPVGREAMHAMIAATAGTACAPLVRVPAIDDAEVKAALDAGAEGIVFPMVRTAADAERCVAAVTYPPEGARGFGPFAAHSRHGTTLASHLSEAGPQTVCAALLETVEAVENADAILAVAGLDLAIVAPFDLSTALGVSGRFDAPEFVAALDTLEAAIDRAGLPKGGVALNAPAAAALLARGFRVLIRGVDVLMLRDAIDEFHVPGQS